MDACEAGAATEDEDAGDGRGRSWHLSRSPGRQLEQGLRYFTHIQRTHLAVRLHLQQRPKETGGAEAGKGGREELESAILVIKYIV